MIMKNCCEIKVLKKIFGTSTVVYVGLIMKDSYKKVIEKEITINLVTTFITFFFEIIN